MVATSDKSLGATNTALAPGLSDHRLLRTVAIYGANAAGKSNWINAAGFIGELLSASIENRPPGTGTGAEPFLLDPATRERPSRFTIAVISAISGFVDRSNDHRPRPLLEIA